MSLSWLARTLGVSVPYLGDVEHDRRNLSLQRLRALMRVLYATAYDAFFFYQAWADAHGRFELETDVSDAKRQLGTMLVRGWHDMTDDDAERLQQLLLYPTPLSPPCTKRLS